MRVSSTLTAMAIMLLACDPPGDPAMQNPERVPIPHVELSAEELGWPLDRVAQERNALIDEIAGALQDTETPATIEWVITTLRDGGDGSMITMTGSEKDSQLLARFYLLDARLNELTSG